MTTRILEELARLNALVGICGGVGNDDQALALWDAIMACTTDAELEKLHDAHEEGFLTDDCGDLDQFKESLTNHRDFVLPYLQAAAAIGWPA